VVEHQPLLRKVVVVMVEEEIQAQLLADSLRRVVMELLDMVEAAAVAAVPQVDQVPVEPEVLVLLSSHILPN
tara:strand:+ start:663 stop:878 length:216 start_codon:yes stop_codon:yes gene_type:complete